MMTVRGHMEQDTVMTIPNYDEPFHHQDRNRLTKVAEPTPNPLALAEQKGNYTDKPILFFAESCPDTFFVAELKTIKCGL